ncbi:hypothetical protein B0T26DRAFT_753359 [Lasiosphaeria miniovina]|uniref:Uncharacterized protein n=1 Tax=Lasiosphaeria miniovina TaxID=1954250 RepID=A0AA40AC93_9PEZI|nr:uncharacterized protein B0T26DRAFT_753359 [Lasiosphaeria miniovina]KAK0713219.1 hypothetical protein B0T26DRAFT_753359 [Lasiosphaeria miniovina]
MSATPQPAYAGGSSMQAPIQGTNETKYQAYVRYQTDFTSWVWDTVALLQRTGLHNFAYDRSSIYDLEAAVERIADALDDPLAIPLERMHSLRRAILLLSEGVDFFHRDVRTRGGSSSSSSNVSGTGRAPSRCELLKILDEHEAAVRIFQRIFHHLRHSQRTALAELEAKAKLQRHEERWRESHRQRQLAASSGDGDNNNASGSSGDDGWWDSDVEEDDLNFNPYDGLDKFRLVVTDACGAVSVTDRASSTTPSTRDILSNY